jgi:pyruvate kinase
LGIEMPFELLPGVQRRLVLAARERGIPAIVATQVLESMRTEPRPTRAEVSDAATAVDQGADAIMLSGETASGQYPIAAVEALRSIIRDAETVAVPPSFLSADPHGPLGFVALRTLHGRAMCEAAVTLATSGHAEAIVAVTRFGKTAQLLSSLRPAAGILAVTPSPEVARRLKLYWGVRPVVSDLQDLRALEVPIRSAMDLSPNAVVVFINISPDLSRADANFVNVQQLAD